MDVDARIQRTGQWLMNGLRRTDQEVGWGQFVETHGAGPPQIGWYGTAAGIGVLCLGGIAPPQEAFDWLIRAWNARQIEEQAASHYSQNARLAISLLALSTTSQQSVAGLKREMASELLSRRLDDATWGEWHASPQDRDARTSADITALAVLALNANRTIVDTNQVTRSAKALSNFVKGQESTDSERLLLPLAAILNASPYNQIPSPVKNLVRSGLAYDPHPDDALTVMYSYGFSWQGNLKIGRDYILVPKIFPYLVLASSTSNIFSRITAQRGILRATTALPIDKDYIFGRGAITATLDQFFVAFGLKQASKAGASKAKWIADVALWVIQKENFFFRFLFPVVIIVVAAVSAADPTLFKSVPCGSFCLPGPEPYTQAIRVVAIAVATIIGKPLLDVVISYVKRKFDIR